MRDKLIEVIRDSDATVKEWENEQLADSLIAAGYHNGPRIPEPGSPEWETTVERMTIVMINSIPDGNSIYRGFAISALNALRDSKTPLRDLAEKYSNPSTPLVNKDV